MIEFVVIKIKNQGNESKMCGLDCVLAEPDFLVNSFVFVSNSFGLLALLIVAPVCVYCGSVTR